MALSDWNLEANEEAGQQEAQKHASRHIIFSAPATYSGTKTIEAEFNPIDSDGFFSLLEAGFRIEKHKGSDTWRVSKRKYAPYGALHVFDYEYVGSEKDLCKVKAWVREQLMKEVKP